MNKRCLKFAVEVLARTIEATVAMKLIAMKELSNIIVDSTLKEKAVTQPTDSKLLQAARAKMLEAAKQEGIALKQTYAKESQVLDYWAGFSTHACNYNLRTSHSAYKVRPCPL